MKISESAETFRVRESVGHMPNTSPGDPYGFFLVQYKSYTLKVIACYGKESGWDHVSVSLPNRCPNWQEMSYIKDLFFDESETVLQFHPKKSEYVNVHPYCLHLWRPVNEEIKLPPSIFV